MTTISLITPIKESSVDNLRLNEYIFLYFDKDNKLKRAIPDYKESFMDSDISLIEEAQEAEKIAIFKLVSKYEYFHNYDMKFNIYVGDNGEVVNHKSVGETIVSLERLLFIPEANESAYKLLKKNK